MACLLLGCGGQEFACPIAVDIVSHDRTVRMAYLEAIDQINTATGEYVFTIGPGGIRSFGWRQPGGQARLKHDLSFIDKDNPAMGVILAVHELFHLIGIDHDDLTDSIMNPIVGPTSLIYPQHIEAIYDYCGY